MATLTTSYQYLGNSPNSGVEIMHLNSAYSRLYLQAKVKSYSDTKVTITARASIRNGDVQWRSTGVSIALTGKSTHSFVSTNSSTIWSGANSRGGSSQNEVWSSTFDFDVDYDSSGTGNTATFNLGLKLTASGMSYSATISNQSCVVNRPGWLVQYNANGGTGAPANQTKTAGNTLTLSNTKPTKANATTTGATATFSDSFGTPSFNTFTTQGATVTYSFKYWTTNQDGTGDIYNPGDPYTKDEAVTLYAQWDANTGQNGAVKFPQSIPNTLGTFKYLKGWTTTNGDPSTLVDTSGYIINSNTTFYAYWVSVESNIKYRSVGGTWSNL